MQELRESAVSQIEEVAAKKNKSILGEVFPFRRANFTDSLIPCRIYRFAGTPGPTRPEGRPLPEKRVLGNIFFPLLARHKRTGNSLAFTLLLLAIHPEYQKELQAELDRQLGGRLKQDWTIGKDYPALQKGYTGAVLQEVLRLYCVIN